MFILYYQKTIASYILPSFGITNAIKKTRVTITSTADTKEIKFGAEMPYRIDIKANIVNITDPTHLLIEVIMPNQAKYFYKPLIHHFIPSGPYSYKLNSFIVLEENAWSGKHKF